MRFGPFHLYWDIDRPWFARGSGVGGWFVILGPLVIERRRGVHRGDAR